MVNEDKTNPDEVAYFGNNTFYRIRESCFLF